MAASSGSPPDFIQMLMNIGQVIPSTIGMIRYVIIFIGFLMVINAVIDIYLANQATTTKFVSVRHQPTFAGATVRIFIGGAMAALGLSLHMVGVASSIFMGDHTPTQLLTLGDYIPDNQPGAEFMVVKSVVVGLLQAVGIVAIAKGLVIWNEVSKGTSKHSGWHGFNFIILGAIAFQSVWFQDMVANTIGYNIFEMIGVNFH